MSHWANEYADVIVANMDQGLLVLDETFAVVEANSTALTLLGCRDIEVLRGTSLGSDTDDIQLRPEFKGRHGGEPRNGRYHISSTFRGDVEADIRFVCRKDRSEGYIVFLSGVKDTDELDKHFFQSEKLAAMDNIVAGIAHELNNPMTAILGYSELLLATEENPKRKKRIALIAEESDRCGKIIANMLSFTRSFGNDFESANLGALVEEVVSLRAYQMRIDGVSVHTSIVRELPMMDLQPSAIRRLFLNIIHNAHQALLEVPEGERNLWVSTRLKDDQILVEVTDSGVGIPEENRYKIFDPFFTTRSLGDGMGLGLSVAYGIVHEHRGEIAMEHRNGGGTSMKISFPVN